VTEPQPELVSVIEELRSSFEADGAELKLLAAEGGVVTVELVLGPQACLECILPGDMIQKVVLSKMRKVDPSVTAVTLVDPRVE
jgi:hypothetical protein